DLRGVVRLGMTRRVPTGPALAASLGRDDVDALLDEATLACVGEKVAQILAAATAAPKPHELAREEAARAAFRASAQKRVRRGHPRLVPLGFGWAAPSRLVWTPSPRSLAAAGDLPGPAERAVTRALDHVGIDLGHGVTPDDTHRSAPAAPSGKAHEAPAASLS